MAKKFNFPALLVSALFAVAATACGNTSTTKTEEVDGVEWNVSVNKVIEFNDSTLGISTGNSYTVADTARINAALKEMANCGNTTMSWTIPHADGSIWLVAYENGPIFSETVNVTEANSMPSYGGNIQIVFKFSDADQWATITKENIGKRLAVIVNGKLMNAPQVNAEITSGNCSVTIPSDMIEEFLPDIDLGKFKQ